MSSEEDYQFKNYFSKDSKEKLIGRLLIEKFVAGDSYFSVFIESLPKIDELSDMHHYSQNHKNELEKRSLVSFTLKDRRVEYDNLVRKIPLNVRIICILHIYFCFKKSYINIYINISLKEIIFNLLC